MESIVLNQDRHVESLERLCVKALSVGDFESAFMYADRRCRILPFVKSHHLILRAEALVRLGNKEGAVADIEAALRLDPEDILANRRMLAWGNVAQREAAAQSLVRSDDDAEVLVQALDVMKTSHCAAAGSCRVTDETIMGWAAWNGEQPPALTVKGAGYEDTFHLEFDPDHPLGGCSFDKVAGFHVRRRTSPLGDQIDLTLAGCSVLSLRCQPNVKPARPRRAPAPSFQQGEGDITVIIPVYRDLAATKLCLTSLEPELRPDGGRRVIIVNDASPEPEMMPYLQSLSEKPGVTLIVNETNLGFVGSVNRAMAACGSSDVVLLNADTIVPPGFLDRMASIAESDSSIGTITPLSNNGEFTSFPLAYEQNPLPSYDRIVEIDRIAATANVDRLIDLPNGIGFCMYVTRRCLDSVGLLSHAYRRGYLEDVDFCLRARERGYRNVCATSIFVGHQGSRSFGDDKRALVVKNLTVAEAKFPAYRQGCALFMTADPLRPARAAIELILSAPAAYDRLLIAGTGLLRDVAERRASELARLGKATLLLCVDHSSTTTAVNVRDGQRSPPQSLSFNVDEAASFNELAQYLETIEFNTIEIVDPAALTAQWIDFMEGLQKPIEIHVADAGVLCPRGTLLQPDGQPCETLGTSKLCPSCATSCPQGDDWRRRWNAFADMTSFPCDQAQQFAEHVLGGAEMPAFARASVKTILASREGASRMGLVVQGRTIEEFRLIQDFLRAAVQRRPHQAFVVLGATFDDLALMRSGNVFVSGMMEEADYPIAVQRYGIERLFLPLRRPLFGHPSSAAAHRLDLPLGYFDWSFGRHRARRNDLPLDPRLSMVEWISDIGVWGGF